MYPANWFVCFWCLWYNFYIVMSSRYFASHIALPSQTPKFEGNFILWKAVCPLHLFCVTFERVKQYSYICNTGEDHQNVWTFLGFWSISVFMNYPYINVLYRYLTSYSSNKKIGGGVLVFCSRCVCFKPGRAPPCDLIKSGLVLQDMWSPGIRETRKYCSCRSYWLLMVFVLNWNYICLSLSVTFFHFYIWIFFMFIRVFLRY